jgi:hypothetical protein
MYNRGCRCIECKQARAAYVRARRIGKPGLTALPTPPLPPLEPGRAEAVIAEEISSLPEAERRPVLVEIARMLARDLDNPNCAASHPALSRELRAVLGELRQGAHSRGKLALVTQKSAPRRTRDSSGSGRPTA